MLTIYAKLTAADGKADELKKALTEMVKNVKEKEAGKTTCYSLHVQNDNPNVFMFYEQYASAEAAEEHGKTDHMRTMGRALRDQALLAGPPVIERFTQVAGVS
jgi:quinol monooxygenase YgiN